MANWLDMVTTGQNTTGKGYLPGSVVGGGGAIMPAKGQPLPVQPVTPTISTTTPNKGPKLGDILNTLRSGADPARAPMVTAGLAYQDPIGYKYNWLMERTPGTGGSPGYDNRADVEAYYNRLRDRAQGQFGGAKKSLSQVYDQMAAMIEPMAAETAKAYDMAINAGATESEALIEATKERINNEAVVRAAAMEDLGITGDPGLSEAAAEAERGMSDIGANTANWGGLMNAFSLGQQARFNQDYIGAGDAKVMAITELVNRYQDYLQRLDDEEQSAMAGAYKPGTPAQPGPMMFETMGSVGNQLMEQYMMERGMLPTPAAPEPYMPSYARDLQWAASAGVGTPEQIAYMQDMNAQGRLQEAAMSGSNLYNPALLPYIK